MDSPYEAGDSAGRGVKIIASAPGFPPEITSNAQVAASARAAAGAQSFQPRILLAEDGEANREIILRMLRSRSFNADVVTDGKKALEACMKGEYDIVFMDCGMPVMDGFESASRVRQLKGPGRPMIVGMTSSVRGSERERCFASGMNDVIAKPFTLDELVAMIRRHAQPD